MESIPLPLASAIIQLLGLPGLIFIIWHFDNKRLDKQRETYEAHQSKQREMYEQVQIQLREESGKQINRILTQYKDEVSAIRHLYETNVELVKAYDKMSCEHVDTIRLNTEAQTLLLAWLKNRIPCHQLQQGKTS